MDIHFNIFLELFLRKVVDIGNIIARGIITIAKVLLHYMQCYTIRGDDC